MQMLLQRVPCAAAQCRDSTWACSTSGRKLALTLQLPCLPPARGLAAQLRPGSRTALYCHRQLQSIRNQQTADSQSFQEKLAMHILLMFASLPCGPAGAEEALKYDPSGGEGLIKTLSGVGYILLLLFFLSKTFNIRARKAREEVRWSLRCMGLLDACQFTRSTITIECLVDQPAA